MSCEDCKNYEKKGNEANAKKNRTHLIALTNLCCEADCEACSLGPNEDNCPLWQAWEKDT